MTSPSRDELVNYLLGALDEPDRLRVAARLEIDAEWREEYWRLRRCFDALEEDNEELSPPPREEVPRYPAAPPTQPAMQSPAYAPAATAPATPGAPPAPGAPGYRSPGVPQRPSILRRPISAEPLGPNNPAPLPSRYR